MERVDDFTAIWRFTGAVGGSGGGADAGLRIGGHPAESIVVNDATSVEAAYAFAFSVGDHWDLTAGPVTFTVTPPLLVPETGLVG